LVEQRQHLCFVLRPLTPAKQRQKEFPLNALLGVRFHFKSSLCRNMFRHQPSTPACKPH
jgi:hypothetical protein